MVDVLACRSTSTKRPIVSLRVCLSVDIIGMSFSLQSRDVIADSIETVMGGQWYDANIAIPGCDKNMPGCLIAMGRVNRPSLMVRQTNKIYARTYLKLILLCTGGFAH